MEKYQEKLEQLLVMIKLKKQIGQKYDQESTAFFSLVMESKQLQNLMQKLPTASAGQTWDIQEIIEFAIKNMHTDDIKNEKSNSNLEKKTPPVSIQKEVQDIDTGIRRTNDNALIRQSNELVEANYKLTIAEQKVILNFCAQIDPHKDHFEVIRLSAKSLSDACGFNPTNGYRQLQNVAKKLLARTIIIKERNGKNWYGTHWVQSCKYVSRKDREESYIQFKLDPDLCPQLLQLKERYLKANIAKLVSFSHVYSTRFYMIFMNRIKIGSMRLTFERLRDLLELGKDYTVKNIKARVIKLAVEEINEKSDLEVSFDYYKKVGYRAHVGVDFRFHLKEGAEKNIENQLPQIESVKQDMKEKEVTAESEYDALRRGMSDEEAHVMDRLVKVAGITPQRAKALVQRYGADRCQRNLEAQRRKNTTNNLGGLVISAINNDWAGQRQAYAEEVRAEEERKKKERRKSAKTQSDIEEHVQQAHMADRVKEEAEKPQQISKDKKALSEVIVDTIRRTRKVNGFFSVALKAGGWTIEDILDGTYDRWLAENK